MRLYFQLYVHPVPPSSDVTESCARACTIGVCGTARQRALHRPIQQRPRLPTRVVPAGHGAGGQCTDYCDADATYPLAHLSDAKLKQYIQARAARSGFLT